MTEWFTASAAFTCSFRGQHGWTFASILPSISSSSKCLLLSHAWICFSSSLIFSSSFATPSSSSPFSFLSHLFSLLTTDYSNIIVHGVFWLDPCLDLRPDPWFTPFLPWTLSTVTLHPKTHPAPPSNVSLPHLTLIKQHNTVCHSPVLYYDWFWIHISEYSRHIPNAPNQEIHFIQSSVFFSFTPCCWHQAVSSVLNLTQLLQIVPAEE